MEQLLQLMNAFSFAEKLNMVEEQKILRGVISRFVEDIAATQQSELAAKKKTKKAAKEVA